MIQNDRPSWRQRLVEWIARRLGVPLYTWPYLIVLDARKVEEAIKAERERMH